MEEILIAQQFDVGEEKDNGHIWYRSYIVKKLFLIINPSWITSLGTISTFCLLSSETIVLVVANWPEVGLESLLVTFVETFSVKLRLIAGFCGGSNTDNSANGDGDVTCPNITITWPPHCRMMMMAAAAVSRRINVISILFISPLNKAIVGKVAQHKKWCWSDSSAQILFLQGKIFYRYCKAILQQGWAFVLKTTF